MSALFSAAKEQIIIWWSVIIYFVLFSCLTLADAVILALYGVTWSGLTPQEKLVIGCMIFKNWGTVMLAFFNKAVSRVKSGQLPMSADDTSFISRPKP